MKSVIDSIKKISQDPLPSSTPIIFLWGNDMRIPDIMSDKECPHEVNSNNRCKYCNSYMGNIGYEKKWWEHVEHIGAISTLLKDKRYLLVSHKYVPEYINGYQLFGGLVKFNHHRKTTFIPKDNVYVSEWYPISEPSNYTLNISKMDLVNFIVNSVKGKVSFVNPTSHVLHSIGNIASDITMCNKGMKDGKFIRF